MSTNLNASELLGNPAYQAICYGGYRNATRDIQPTIDQLKEDLLILSALGIRVIRTYNVHLPHASNVLQAIRELKDENSKFEMYVMLGAWIDCKNAWTDQEPDHMQESERNAVEIETAIELVNKYPDIVKILAVGNEAMVKWAAAYYVQPGVILKWVNYLQEKKSKGELPKDLWITSSDNFASWGGGSPEYHMPDLVELMKAVDYISLHTYPMHDTYYNPSFWGVLAEEEMLKKEVKIDLIMDRALAYAKNQFYAVKAFMDSLGIDKPIHIGETGWASHDSDNHHYGKNGSRATDEYKAGIYYQKMRSWTDSAGISCFYFEAFDEPWKDAMNPGGSENHFGLFTLEGKAKYAIWDQVDKGTLKGLERSGVAIVKTHEGNYQKVMDECLMPSQLLSIKE